MSATSYGIVAPALPLVIAPRVVRGGLAKPAPTALMQAMVVILLVFRTVLAQSGTGATAPSGPDGITKSQAIGHVLASWTVTIFAFLVGVTSLIVSLIAGRKTQSSHSTDHYHSVTL